MDLMGNGLVMMINDRIGVGLSQKVRSNHGLSRHCERAGVRNARWPNRPPGYYATAPLALHKGY